MSARNVLARPPVRVYSRARIRTSGGDVVADVAQHLEDLGVGKVGREAGSVDDLRHVCARKRTIGEGNVVVSALMQRTRSAQYHVPKTNRAGSGSAAASPTTVTATRSTVVAR